MPDREAVQITEIPARAVVRLKPSSQAEMSEASIMPSGLGERVRVLSFSPCEWLVVSDVIEGPRLAERLQAHVAGEAMAVVDLSCALKALWIEGPAAREVLRKGCGLDLHPRAFPAGHCTRTRLGQLAVIVDCTDPAPRFDLYVGRSYVTYLKSWLIDAAAEFRDQS